MEEQNMHEQQSPVSVEEATPAETPRAESQQHQPQEARAEDPQPHLAPQPASSDPPPYPNPQVEQEPAAPAPSPSPSPSPSNTAADPKTTAAQAAAGPDESQPPAPRADESQPQAGLAAAAPKADKPENPENPQNAEKQDFGAILADFEQHAPARRDDPEVGKRVSGKVVSIRDESVFVDLGTKSEGMIEAAQLRDAEGNLSVQVGDKIDATVASIDAEGGLLVLKKRVGGGRGHQEVATELRQAFQYGMPVEGMVTGINKGGAEVQVYGMRAFCPLSQLDLRYVENPQQFIGQRLKFRINRIEEGSRNRRPDIVLSRRTLLEEEAQAKAAELRARLQVGAVVRGKVTSITSYGAFLDLGGLEGLLHVSEIGFSRLTDPKEALAVGQELEVQVIKIEKGKDEKRPERISLSRKALERDPWRDAADRFAEGAVVPGRVVRLESFGAFVELAPGLEGLVHISELGAGRRVNHPKEVAQIGQDVQVRVLGVDKGKRRISLSMALGSSGGGSDREREREREEEPAPQETAGAAASQPTSFGSLGDFFKNSGGRRR
jgi:small subunit ribosomal protein S1